MKERMIKVLHLIILQRTSGFLIDFAEFSFFQPYRCVIPNTSPHTCKIRTAVILNGKKAFFVLKP